MAAPSGGYVRAVANATRTRLYHPGAVRLIGEHDSGSCSCRRSSYSPKLVGDCLSQTLVIAEYTLEII